MLCDTVVEYVIEAKERHQRLLEDTDDYEHFYFYQGKITAYSEVLRVLDEQCK
jgi:hypothetical protein